MNISSATMDKYSAEQHMVAQQVKVNGQAVARLTRCGNLTMMISLRVRSLSLSCMQKKPYLLMSM
jgi:hypothetical protein